MAGDRNGSCDECGASVPRGDLLKCGEVMVCVGCKETLVRKLELGVPIGQGVWMDGKYLVMENRATVPKLCVKCGNEGTAHYRRPVFWVPVWLVWVTFPIVLFLVWAIRPDHLNIPRRESLAIIVGALLIPAIIAIVMSRRGVVSFFLCANHENQRRWAKVGMLLFLAVSGAGILIERQYGAFPEFMSGWRAFGVVGAIMCWGIAGVLSVSSFKDGLIRFRGAGASFLNQVPTWRQVGK